jgi:predicted component of type VI protein secretion system
MKKTTSFGIYAILFLALGAFGVGCSSSKKVEDSEAPITMSEESEIDLYADSDSSLPSDSLNLGASSAGRAH